jgi:hypothetical protein
MLVFDKAITVLAASRAALLFAALTPATALAAPVGGTCSPTKLKYLASALETASNSTTAFANIPEASVTFAQGGTKPSCVIVRFSARTHTDSSPANNVVVIRAFLDNTTAALPAEVGYSGDDGTVFRAHSFEFIFPSVAPGVHTVRMQFRNRLGGTSRVLVHNTVVQYAP